MLPATTSPSLMPMPESRLDLVALLPGARQVGEAGEHLARGAHGALRAVGLLERHAEAEHQAVAGHVKHRALVAEGDLGEEREVLVEQRHHLLRLELLGDAGEAAQVGEQHHRVGAHVGGGEQRVAQLRVLEDLVGDPRRHVTAEGLPQDLLATSDFRLELYRGASCGAALPRAPGPRYGPLRAHPQPTQSPQ